MTGLLRTALTIGLVALPATAVHAAAVTHQCRAQVDDATDGLPAVRQLEDTGLIAADLGSGMFELECEVGTDGLASGTISGSILNGTVSVNLSGRANTAQQAVTLVAVNIGERFVAEGSGEARFTVASAGDWRMTGVAEGLVIVNVLLDGRESTQAPLLGEDSTTESVELVEQLQDGQSYELGIGLQLSSGSGEVPAPMSRGGEFRVDFERGFTLTIETDPGLTLMPEDPRFLAGDTPPDAGEADTGAPDVGSPGAQDGGADMGADAATPADAGLPSPADAGTSPGPVTFETSGCTHVQKGSDAPSSVLAWAAFLFGVCRRRRGHRQVSFDQESSE